MSGFAWQWDGMGWGAGRLGGGATHHGDQSAEFEFIGKFK